MTKDKIRQKALEAGINQFEKMQEGTAPAALLAALNATLDVFTESHGFMSQPVQPLVISAQITRVDYFIGQALSGLLSNPENINLDFSEYVLDAYHIGKQVDNMVAGAMPKTPKGKA